MLASSSLTLASLLFAYTALTLVERVALCTPSRSSAKPDRQAPRPRVLRTLYTLSMLPSRRPIGFRSCRVQHSTSLLLLFQSSNPLFFRGSREMVGTETGAWRRPASLPLRSEAERPLRLSRRSLQTLHSTPPSSHLIYFVYHEAETAASAALHRRLGHDSPWSPHALHIAS